MRQASKRIPDKDSPGYSHRPLKRGATPCQTKFLTTRLSATPKNGF